MASVVSEKLYPPNIGSSIPAFYNNGGTVQITVPFSMNRAVDPNSVFGFHLKIKTVQSNSYITTLSITSTADVLNALNTHMVVFNWPTTDRTYNFYRIQLGQYLKVQIAYVGADGIPGYFSTVGIVKYTSKPNVYIDGAQSQTAGRIEIFKKSYVGVYETGTDKSERPYSYNFYLYDRAKELVETSGWRLHNSSVNTTASESLSLDRATDAYSFDLVPNEGEEYYVQYAVRTINNMEIYSPLYVCVEPSNVASRVPFDLKAENIFDEGYVLLTLQQKAEETIDLNEQQSISLEISRAEKTDGYNSWQLMKRAYFSSYGEMLSWTFRDFAIEQGVGYKYCFRQYTQNDVLSNRNLSNEVLADFEDMFLWDGKRQLKIRFNPKVSSFKANRLEQKIDTIGSRFPFIFRNGVVNYKEFPISGLISYLADNNELFIHHEEDLNIVMNDNSKREGTPTTQKSYETVATTSSIGYNMRAERRFKLKLLEWLGNGEVKFFKSPAEGNYLVRLLNISLSPEDRVGRMIHTFNSTAYEVEEINYNNLVALGFISVDESMASEVRTMSFYLRDKISLIPDDDLTSSIKLNDYDIIDLIDIEPSVDIGSNPFILRMGADNTSNLVQINTSFVLQSDNTNLPNLYFNIGDQPGVNSKAAAIDLVGDTTVTYKYTSNSVQIGELDNIDSIFITNKIESFFGPVEQDFSGSVVTVDDKVGSEEVLKFFVLDFKKKVIKDLVYKNGNYYESNESSAIINHFDQISLYQIFDANGNQMGKLKYTNAAGDRLYDVEDENEIWRIGLTDEETGEETVFYNPPVVDLNNTFYSQISLGAGIYLNCAYQCKTTVLKG